MPPYAFLQRRNLQRPDTAGKRNFRHIYHMIEDKIKSILSFQDSADSDFIDDEELEESDDELKDVEELEEDLDEDNEE